MNNFESNTRYIFSDGEYVKQKSIREFTTRRSNRGLVIEGVASKFETNLYHDRLGFVNIMPGAFDISLKYPEAPIEAWLDHCPALALTDCKVELLSTETELNFRVHLSDSEICNQARDLVACGAYTQCSLGWNSSKTISRDICGTPVAFILQGTLTHIALVPAGAIKTTHCQVSELKNCGTLAEDCKSSRFKSENDFVAIRRAMQKLESQ
jgi:HK97 family phage prohead protease